MRIKNNLKNWAGFFGAFALIFYLSSKQGGSTPLLPFVDSDKALHFSIYYLLGFTFTRAIYNQSRFWRLGHRWLLVGFIVAPGFAIFDEWHQSFVPGRSVEWLDGVFDVLGFAVAILTFELAQRTQLRKRFLPLTEMRDKILMYRLQMCWSFWLVIVWDLYFSAFPLRNSTLTNYFGKEAFLIIAQTMVWALQGILWARFWLWESWWQGKTQNQIWVFVGYIFGLICIGLEGVLRWRNQSLQMFWVLQGFEICGYTLAFALYDWGLKKLQHSQPAKHETEAPACELPVD